MPDTPALAESGLSGFDTSAWFAVLVAKATPEPLRSEIERVVVSALKAPDVKERLAKLGVDIAAGRAAELANCIEADSRMWRDVIERAGIRSE